MDKTIVKNTVIAVLADIQAAQDLECPPMDGSDRPIDVLQDFDSKMWPGARGKIGRKLGIKIPKDINIFGDENDKAYTIDQTVALVCGIAKNQENQEELKKTAKQ